MERPVQSSSHSVRMAQIFRDAQVALDSPLRSPSTRGRTAISNTSRTRKPPPVNRQGAPERHGWFPKSPAPGPRYTHQQTQNGTRQSWYRPPQYTPQLPKWKESSFSKLLAELNGSTAEPVSIGMQSPTEARFKGVDDWLDKTIDMVGTTPSDLPVPDDTSNQNDDTTPKNPNNHPDPAGSGSDKENQRSTSIPTDNPPQLSTPPQNRCLKSSSLVSSSRFQSPGKPGYLFSSPALRRSRQRPTQKGTKQDQASSPSKVTTTTNTTTLQGGADEDDEAKGSEPESESAPLVPLSPLVEVHRKSHRPKRNRCPSYFDHDIIILPSPSSHPQETTTTNVIAEREKEKDSSAGGEARRTRNALEDHPLSERLTRPDPFCEEAEDFEFRGLF
ncbi:MAG: hypothetical protein M1837_007230 [Sclerophora amabilis]|nr:MAG: hypothetical protein M1837_007230 [Sclerophora amabilis]